MSEISDAIWRIVEPRIIEREGLADAANPSKIRSRRGIAYLDSSGGISTKSGSDASGGDEAGAPGAGQEVDPENPAVIQEITGDNQAGGGGDSKPAGTVSDTKKGDKTKNVTGDDYTTGTNGGGVKVVINAVDEAARDKPPNWDDPDTPPDYAAGSYWDWGTNDIPGTDGKGYTENDSARSVQNQLGSGTYQYVFKTGGLWYFATNQGVGPSGQYFVGTYVNGVASDPAKPYHFGGYAGVDFALQSCPETSPPSVCTVPPPASTFDWEDDGQCHLSWDTATGTFKGNGFDVNCSAAQVAGTAEVYIDSGGIRKKISHLANGGFKITDVDASNVDDPAGYTRIYSADGILESITTTGVGGQVE